MKADVKVFPLPGGGRIVTDENDAKAKAEALRLGMMPALESTLRQRAGQQSCAAAIVRDGTRLVAVVAWQGFKSASDNGWLSISATPVCERNAALLLKMTRQLTASQNVRMIDGVRGGETDEAAAIRA